MFAKGEFRNPFLHKNESADRIIIIIYTLLGNYYCSKGIKCFKGKCYIIYIRMHIYIYIYACVSYLSPPFMQNTLSMKINFAVNYYIELS